VNRPYNHIFYKIQNKNETHNRNATNFIIYVKSKTVGAIHESPAYATVIFNEIVSKIPFINTSVGAIHESPAYATVIFNEIVSKIPFINTPVGAIHESPANATVKFNARYISLRLRPE
jgi:hypothetical protein